MSLSQAVRMGLLALLAATPAARAEAPATWPAPTRPAHPPVPQDLAADARGLAAACLERLGAGYKVLHDPQRHIVYVSGLDETTVRFVTGLLTAHADAHRRMLFPEPLRWNIAVILPTVADYRRLSPMPKATGFYHHPSRTLLSISLSGVLLHEFTHALHHNDQAAAGQFHAVWVAEGLATLFQTARVEDGRLEVKADPDVAVLKDALADEDPARHPPPLAELVAMTGARVE